MGNRHWRALGVALLIFGSAVTALPPARAGADSSLRKRGAQGHGTGTTTTSLVGAWQATPSLFPTGGPVAVGCDDLTYKAVVTLFGSFVGAWQEEAFRTTVCDTSQLPDHWHFHTTGTGTLTGMYFDDHSRGSLTFAGDWDGDVVSGALTGEFTITGGSGDPTFRCSGGHLSFSGALVAGVVSGFGGYRGVWVHRCRK